MRKTLALFSVAALLVVLLVGCGQKMNSSTGGLNTGSTGTTNGTGGGDTNGSTSGTGSTGNTGNTGDTANGSGSMTGGGSVTGSAIGGTGGNAASRWGSSTMDDTTDRNTNATANAQLRGNSRSMTGTVATPGTMLDGDEQYRRMLANAHVHDTDGYLLDGENAQYVTW